MLKKLITYLSILLLSAVTLSIYLGNFYSDISYFELIFWCILLTVTESLLIELPNRPGGVSVGTAISLACIIIGGPFFAAITAGVGFLFRMPYIKGRGRIHIFNTPIQKTIFNVSQAILISGISGMVYVKLTNDRLGIFHLGIMITVIICYELLNILLTSILFCIITKHSFYKLLIQNTKEVALNSFGIGIVGVIIALAYIHYSYGAVLLFFGPLLLARYTFRLYMDMRSMYLETIHAFNMTLECKDSYTGGHSKRVEKYATKLARGMKLSEKQIQEVSTAALMHDIGKIAIPDEILNKKGRLTDEEYEMMKTHPDAGADILANVDFLKEIAEIIRCHHEWWDGTGYPNKLKDKEIPIESAILAVADVYDAMTSERPYRAPMSKEQALKELENNAGTQFSKELVVKFIELMTTEKE